MIKEEIMNWTKLCAIIFIELMFLTIAYGAEENDPTTKKQETFHWLDGLSGNFALTSNYVFRGISQTENLPAIQGSLTYLLPVGLYVSVWGSNVKFTGTDATVELDTIAGYRSSIGEDFSLDINFARYNYPSARELNYNEINSVFIYKILQFGFSYSGNEYNSHDVGTYYNGGINYNIPSQYIFNIEDVNLLALLGYSNLSRAAGGSYSDYNIALSKKINEVYTLMVQWTGTNGGQHNPPYDSNHLIGTLTANF